MAENTDLKLRVIRKGCDSVRSFLLLGERMREKKISLYLGQKMLKVCY